MFVSGTLTRVRDSEDADVRIVYPVQFEDDTQGRVHDPVARLDTRETAQKVADALNAVLTANGIS
jgi:hypothetical protein